MNQNLVKLETFFHINPRKELLQDSDKVSFVPMSNVSEIQKIVTSEEERQFSEVSKGYTPFHKGDLLLAKITPCFENGKIAIANIKNEVGFGSSEFHVFRPKNEDVCVEYLYYFFQQKKFMKLATINMTGSAGQKRVPAKFLSKIKIPLPPLPMQKKIVRVLDKARELIDWREEQIRLLDELVQSVFYDMFGDPVGNPMGWEVKKLGEIFPVMTGATPSRKKAIYWNNPTISWVKTNEVINSIIASTEEMINSIALKETSVTLFPKNTILIAMYGQGKTRGRVAKLGIEATTNQACAAVLPDQKNNMNFIFYYLKLSYEKLRSLGRGGNQPNLNLGLVKDFEIIVPPIEVQNSFSDNVQKIEAQKSLMQQSLEEMRNNYNSLMQRAFKGELFE